VRGGDDTMLKAAFMFVSPDVESGKRVKIDTPTLSMMEHDDGWSKRLREAEIQKVEAQRAFNVAIAKISHGLIEAAERARKTSLINSLLFRILVFLQNSDISLSLFKGLQLTSSIPYPWRDFVEPIIDTYKSIRNDIKDNLKIKDFEKLFPERPTYFETPSQAVTVISQLSEQLTQLMAYLLRFT